MKKKILGILMLLVLLPALLSAVPVVVTWEWMLGDPNVTTFRYQIDGEDPNAWITVDASQTSYTVEGLDGTRSYSLYLQQSYDGVNFSSSAVATAEPLEKVVTEPAPVAAEPVPATEPVAAPVASETPVAEVAPAVETPVPVAEAPAPVKEEPVVEKAVEAPVPEPVAEPAPVKEAPAAETPAPAKEAKASKSASKPAGVKMNQFNFALGLNAAGDYRVAGPSSNSSGSHGFNGDINLDLGFNNIIAMCNRSGLGLSMLIGYEPYPTVSWKKIFKSEFWNTLQHRMSATALLEYDLAFSKGIGMNAGVGMFAIYPFNTGLSFKDSLAWGLAGNLGFYFKFTKGFTMDIAAVYRYYFDDANKNLQAVGASLGFGYRF